MKNPEHPVCLTIAGSDSGGGAGIQADLRAFAAGGVFGTSAITAVTAQSPHGVAGVEVLSCDMVVKQIEAVQGAFSVSAIKTGMLATTDIVTAVADTLVRHAACPLVVDPVMVATSGAKLLDNQARDALMTRLLPMSTVFTPNMPEARALLGLHDEEAINAGKCVRELGQRFGACCVLKGGHEDLENRNYCTDWIWDGEAVFRLDAPVIDAKTTHGTGCAFASSLSAGLARGMSVVDAASAAKSYVNALLTRSVKVGESTWGNMLPENVEATVTVRAVY